MKQPLPAFRLSGFPAARRKPARLNTVSRCTYYGGALNGRFQNRAPRHSHLVPLRFQKRPFSAMIQFSVG